VSKDVCSGLLPWLLFVLVSWLCVYGSMVPWIASGMMSSFQYLLLCDDPMSVHVRTCPFWQLSLRLFGCEGVRVDQLMMFEVF